MASFSAQSYRELLRELTFGEPVAELEKQALAQYFVETDQWRRLLSGHVDIVYGAKGSGKSALYSLLTQKSTGDDLLTHGILVVPMEQPSGTPAFQALALDPPPTEELFVGLWKLYFLTLLAAVLVEWQVKSEPARAVYRALRGAGLLQPRRPLATVIVRVREYVKRLATATSLEASMQIDPASGMPVAFTSKITLAEPAATESDNGNTSVDALLHMADEALGDLGSTVWLVADRLDVAFPDQGEVEARALRALFRTYLNTLDLEHVKPKLFLRSDIWRRITTEGFREASHITRDMTLAWDTTTLRQLVARRLLNNSLIRSAYDHVGSGSLDQTTFEAILEAVLPRRLDELGRLESFESIVEAIQDGAREPAPRELIQLFSATRDAQMRRIEAGQDLPDDDALFSSASVVEGFGAVSATRLHRTLFAEYSRLKPYVERLADESPSLSLQTLAHAWRVTTEKAEVIAEELVDVGFFERRRSRRHPMYVVPLLYRPALRMPLVTTSPFLPFGRQVIHETATRLRDRFPPPTSQHSYSDAGSETVLVSFEGRQRRPMIVALTAAESGSAGSLRGASDVVHAGILEMDGTELLTEGHRDELRGADFNWVGFFNSRREGFRAFLRYDDIQGRKPERIAAEFAEAIVDGLRRAKLMREPRSSVGSGGGR